MDSSSSIWIVTVQPPPLTVKKKFWIKSGYSVIIIYNETVERGCDKWAEIMKKESITN